MRICSWICWLIAIVTWLGRMYLFVGLDGSFEELGVVVGVVLFEGVIFVTLELRGGFPLLLDPYAVGA